MAQSAFKLAWIAAGVFLAGATAASAEPCRMTITVENNFDAVIKATKLMGDGLSDPRSTYAVEQFSNLTVPAGERRSTPHQHNLANGQANVMNTLGSSSRLALFDGPGERRFIQLEYKRWEPENNRWVTETSRYSRVCRDGLNMFLPVPHQD